MTTDELNRIEKYEGSIYPNEKSTRHCFKCNSTTTVTNGEVQYCGNCGAEFSSTLDEEIFEFDKLSEIDTDVEIEDINSLNSIEECE